MQKVKLGKTGLEVSRVGMGGIPIQRPPRDDAIRMIQHALDRGITFIDTAYGYGESEERIGTAISEKRDEVILATKGGWRDKKMTMEHIDVSLKRLKTDYIDLWQFHNISTLDWYDIVTGPGGALEAAQDAVKEGKILHIGISSHNLDVAKKAVCSGLFETIQFPFNIVANEAADELIPLARNHKVGFIAMKPFAGGNIENANLAIKYLLQYDTVVPDPGIQKLKEIDEITDIVNGSWELTPDQYREIQKIREKLGTRFCRQCMYCMPCSQGVEIWLLMYLRNLHRLWPPEEFFPWVGKVVATAENCIQCGECEEKCPYNLPIRELMKENIDFYERVKKDYGSTET